MGHPFILTKWSTGYTTVTVVCRLAWSTRVDEEKTSMKYGVAYCALYLFIRKKHFIVKK